MSEKDTSPIPKGLGRLIDVQEEKDEELQKLCDEKNIVLLAFIGSYIARKYNPVSSSRATINLVDEFGIEEALREICQRTKSMDTKRVYLLINSLGGGISSSFKIAQAIRDAFEEITVFVPHIAASGGTLLALTGNKVRMGVMSQLSPVDPQRQYKGNEFVSVNSISRAKRRLDKKFAKHLEQEIGYPDRHMADLIDPVVYEEFYGLCKASENYLETILQKTGYAKSDIENIKTNLIFGLPTHSFVIDKNLAKEIGINIESDSTDLEEWNLMRNWFAKYVALESDKHFIRYCIPKQNDKD